jgi:release factor glutamine methyltransferase
MPKPDTWTIGSLIAWAKDYLTRYGVSSPRLSAELMLGNALGYSRVELYMRYDQPLKKAELNCFKELLLRRRGHEPMAYILGEKEFWGLDFKVGPGVLVPRPETEHLVEEALARLPKGEPLRILDLCTGSGAIALSLAMELPQAEVCAVELEHEALKYAQYNLDRHELNGRVNLYQGSLYDPVAPAGGFFEMITANPPYIPQREYDELSPGVKEFEPEKALLAGKDGLEITRHIIRGSGAFLRAGGWLLVELGAGQAQAATAIARASGIFEEVAVAPDLAGIDRVLICQRGDYG